jgi:16S rRNA (uracil1498-N3)-methyltransferase
MADRYFYPEPITPVAEVILDGPEAHHLISVMRAKVGTKIELFNGDGFAYPAEVIDVFKREANLLIHERIDAANEAPLQLTIATALPKGDRLDFLIEKLVELGAFRLIPLQTERSVVVPKEAKLEKWQRAVIEASKQCRRNKLMEISSPMTLKELLSKSIQGKAYFAHPGFEVLPKVTESNESKTTEILVAVGPEGGFSDAEVGQFQAASWQGISLGRRILRIETAALKIASCLLD